MKGRTGLLSVETDGIINTFLFRDDKNTLGEVHT
jgi:hypothetical protein